MYVVGLYVLRNERGKGSMTLEDYLKLAKAGLEHYMNLVKKDL